MTRDDALAYGSDYAIGADDQLETAAEYRARLQRDWDAVFHHGRVNAYGYAAFILARKCEELGLPPHQRYAILDVVRTLQANASRDRGAAPGTPSGPCDIA